MNLLILPIVANNSKVTDKHQNEWDYSCCNQPKPQNIVIDVSLIVSHICVSETNCMTFFIPRWLNFKEPKPKKLYIHGFVKKWAPSLIDLAPSRPVYQYLLIVRQPLSAPSSHKITYFWHVLSKISKMLWENILKGGKLFQDGVHLFVTPFTVLAKADLMKDHLCSKVSFFQRDLISTGYDINQTHNLTPLPPFFL